MPRQLLLAHLALKAIRRNWRHSLATMLAIMGGYAAVSLFDGFLSAIHDYNEEHFIFKGMTGHVIVEKAGASEHLGEDPWAYSLSREEQNGIRRILETDPRVRFSMGFLVITGLISNGQNSALFIGAGLDDDLGMKIRGPKWAWNAVAGAPLAHSPPGGGLFLGMGLARRMGCEFEEKIHQNPDGSYIAQPFPLHCPGAGLQLSVTTEHAQINALTLPVVGVNDLQLREFNDKVLSLPLATAQALFDTDRLSRVTILLRDSSLIPAFVRDFRARAREAGLAVEVLPWLEHPIAAVAKGGLEVMAVFRALFLAVVAVIAAMSVANSMMKSINERVREIGALRSFGFRRRDIVWLFSFEGLFLGLASCLGGILVTMLLVLLLTHLGITFKAGVLSTPIPLMFSMPLSLWLTTALGLSFITFLAAWLVARRAARLGIAEALRHTA